MHVYMYVHVGLSDPWNATPAEPPPSYDTVTGAAIRDPWAAVPSTAAEPTSLTGMCH